MSRVTSTFAARILGGFFYFWRIELADAGDAKADVFSSHWTVGAGPVDPDLIPEMSLGHLAFI
jgi:hypothetical protein